jgi:chorismate synthase
VEIVSGTFEGRTTGTPISLIIRNRDADSAAYEELRDIFRPGHGDFTYYKKYGIRDHRGGGRASARETVARVAAGAIAKKVISSEGIRVIAYTKELGGIAVERISFSDIQRNTLQCPDLKATEKMVEKLEGAKKKGDSLGGIVEIIVRGCPPGLGEPVCIGTVKGVEIGVGFQAAKMTGFECNDPITPEGFSTNNAGGILAGITNGDEIVIRVACKPISSVGKTQETVDVHGKPVTLSIRGRHDVCVIPRIIPVCEAMVRIILADHVLRQRANLVGQAE